MKRHIRIGNGNRYLCGLEVYENNQSEEKLCMQCGFIASGLMGFIGDNPTKFKKNLNKILDKPGQQSLKSSRAKHSKGYLKNKT